MGFPLVERSKSEIVENTHSIIIIFQFHLAIKHSICSITCMQCIDNNQTYLVISEEDFQLELNLFQIFYQVLWNEIWDLQHFFVAQIGINSLFEKLTPDFTE